MADSVALRCYVDHKRKNKAGGEEADARPCNNSVVLCFDTETTTDIYQNLQFGGCGVWVNDQLVDYYEIYADDLCEKDINLIKEYAAEHGYTALDRTAFVDDVFFPRVLDEGAICVGFNLAFDISRLAISASYSGMFEDGFSFVLSTVRGRPRIAIKSLDSKRAFIKFTSTCRTKRRIYRGCFVDTKTACFALTGDSHSLKSAVEVFGCTRAKTHTEVLGVVTRETLDYNVNDVLTTHELYVKVRERYTMYGLSKDLSQIYSPAGIGKAILEEMGVRPFMDKNPDFPKEVLGYLMNAYFGGRTEVRDRRTPVKVEYRDFTSMYPSVYSLCNMDRFLKADKIVPEDSTAETQRLLDAIEVGDIQNKELWPKLLTICQIRPYGDVLPARSDYTGDGTFTIGINHVTSRGPRLWFTLMDLITAKFSNNGRAPVIERAITFRPVGVQDGLRDIEILPGITVKKEEDFIRKLMEERIRVKATMKNMRGDGARDLGVKEHILKIIANSTSYGIYIEVNAKAVEDEPVTVYGLEAFETTVNKVETPGWAFNPVMAVFLTAGARLILATAEVLVTGRGGEFAYCDTDSCFITPGYGMLLEEFFQPLNPYDVPVDMFKLESDDEGPLYDVWFFGISAKRYVLYDRDPVTGEINVRKHSTHGLGGMVGFEKEK